MQEPHKKELQILHRAGSLSGSLQNLLFLHSRRLFPPKTGSFGKRFHLSHKSPVNDKKSHNFPVFCPISLSTMKELKEIK